MIRTLVTTSEVTFTADSPIASVTEVACVDVTGVSDRNANQRVFIGPEREEVCIVQMRPDGRVMRNVTINTFGIDMGDIPDVLTALDRADAVNAYRAAHDAVFNALQVEGVRDRYSRLHYRLSLAHRTCEIVRDGIRRA